MKIRIIKNNPPDDLASDITHLIGQVFEAKIDGEGYADIDYPKGTMFTIFKGEYEIVKEEDN